MVYRKGERRVAKEVRAYTPDHPVARWIMNGDHWMTAWVGQMCTPWATITKKTGISQERLSEFKRDAEPTPEELEELAALWWVTPEGLRRSIDQMTTHPGFRRRRERLATNDRSLGAGSTAMRGKS